MKVPSASDAGPGGDSAPVEPIWRHHLICSDNGRAKPLLANAIIAFRQAPEWQGIVAFDEFAHKVVARGRTPWATSDAERGHAWASVHDALAADWLQHRGIHVSPDVAGQAIDVAARDQPYHPVRDYLEHLHWDGRPRLDQWTTTFLGAEDTPYARAVGSRWMISAIARVYQPGCKADHVLILEGHQGTLKSTALKTLGEPWFSDEVAELGTKDASMQLLGVWIIELAELSSMRRAEVGRVNAFITRTVDRFRPPYGRRVAEFERQCVFVGTVNDAEYLRDLTGGRRWWPLKCAHIDVDGLSVARDQLWAEARSRFLAGEAWWLDTSDLDTAAKGEQEARRQHDPWEPLVADYLVGKMTVSVSEILTHLSRRAGEWTQSDANRVAGCLTARDWKRYQVGSGIDRGKWRYKPAKAPEESPPDD